MAVVGGMPPALGGALSEGVAPGQGTWEPVAELGQDPISWSPLVLGTQDWAVDRMQVTAGGGGNVMVLEGQELQLSLVCSTVTDTSTTWRKPGRVHCTPPQQLPVPGKGHLGPRGPSRALPLAP